MHEIGVLMEVIGIVERYAKEQEVEKIQELVLQVGELSSMIPEYLQKLYPAATDKTILENSELRIEVIPGNALCKQCNKVFHLVSNKGICPHCEEKNFEILSGKEFNIKEILCY